MLIVVQLGVLLQALASFSLFFVKVPFTLNYLGTLIGSLGLLFYFLPTRKALWFLACSLFWTSAGEFLGQKYGLFFVKYHYVPEAWPAEISGILPLVVPWIWFMMLVPSWLIAKSLITRFKIQPSHARIYSPLLTAALMLLWDLILDPLQVSRGLWVWDKAGPYFGIPWENFLSWFLGVGITICCIEWKATVSHKKSPAEYWAKILYAGMFFNMIIDVTLSHFSL